MLARVPTLTLDGLDARVVWVEADIRSGLRTFAIVGLADKAVREARERVQSALLNSGYVFPKERITVNLAPASLRKIGPSFDLALALAVLAASEQVDRQRALQVAACGELSLAGELRTIRGALALAEAARREGIGTLLLPPENAPEAALIAGVETLAVDSVIAAVEVVNGTRTIAPSVPDPRACAEPPAGERLELADVRGQAPAVEATVIAAAGGHNLLLSGPPGTGKTMLARRLPSILPPLTPAEAVEVTRIHSIAGAPPVAALRSERPFRAPHHTISSAGLVGGDAPPRPGEVTLAHGGVLFLDELSEFGRAAIEALRQPLEDGRVAIVRGQRARIFPTRFMLVAATNPCPCGYHGEPRCQCDVGRVVRHLARLSGPLLDRIDVRVDVRRPGIEALRRSGTLTSERARERVLGVRAYQAERYAGTGLTTNSELPSWMVASHAALQPAAERLLAAMYDRGELSARGHLRVIRVARTIADLDGSSAVLERHVDQALTLRSDPVTLRVAA